MRIFLTLALSGLLLPAAAKADTFNFSAMGGGFSGAGQIIATKSGATYTINSITGTGIGGLIGVNDNGQFIFTNDNLLFPGASRTVDVNGLAFTEMLGGMNTQVNIFSNLGFNPPSGVIYYADTYDLSGNYLAETPITFTLAPAAVTPEPSSLILMGSGVLAVALAGVRRRFAL